MVAAAVADVDGLEASRIEIDAGGPSYTADTLAALLAEDPTRELFVILGADAAAGPPDLGALRRGARPGRRSSWSSGPAPQPARRRTGWRWTRVEVPSLEVSSTDLRARVGRRPPARLPRHPRGGRLDRGPRPLPGRARDRADRGAGRPTGRAATSVPPRPRSVAALDGGVLRRSLTVTLVAGGGPRLRRRADRADEPGRQERVDRHRSRRCPASRRSSSRRPPCSWCTASGTRAGVGGRAGAELGRRRRVRAPGAADDARRLRDGRRPRRCVWPPSAVTRRRSVPGLQVRARHRHHRGGRRRRRPLGRAGGAGRAAHDREPGHRGRVPSRAALARRPTRSAPTWRARGEGESDLARLYRQQLFFEAWADGRGRARRTRPPSPGRSSRGSAGSCGAWPAGRAGSRPCP